MATLDKFEIAPFGPYRFIGKSIYTRLGGQGVGEAIGALWDNSSWVFEALDGLKEHATAETHNMALINWEKYDEKTKLMGYTVGRFMKAGTPVPEGMDFFDIPAAMVAKSKVSGTFGDMVDDAANQLTKAAISQHGKYVGASWIWSAEVYTEDTVRDDNVSSSMGFYIPCKEAKKKRRLFKK